MAEANAAQCNVNIGVQQVGTEMYVTITFAAGPLAAMLTLQPSAVRQVAIKMREACDVAEKTIIKPPSAITEA